MKTIFSAHFTIMYVTSLLPVLYIFSKFQKNTRFLKKCCGCIITVFGIGVIIIFMAYKNKR